MFQPILSDSLLQDPASPQDETSNVFSFYIHDPRDINLFNPTSVSTPRKSHHVSMPALLARPALLRAHNLSLDHKIKTPLQKTSALRPFLIRVQSSSESLENARNTLNREYTKPTKGRESTAGLVKRARAQHMRKGGVFWMKVCARTIKRRLSSNLTPDDKARARQRCYYFI